MQGKIYSVKDLAIVDAPPGSGRGKVYTVTGYVLVIGNYYQTPTAIWIAMMHNNSIVYAVPEILNTCATRVK